MSRLLFDVQWVPLIGSWSALQLWRLLERKRSSRLGSNEKEGVHVALGNIL